MPDRRPNVILLVFDTLRKDAVGCYGRTPPWGDDFPAVATPHLDAFARDAVRFTNAYPEVLPTLPARRAIYTGRRVYPFHNGFFRHRGDFPTAPGWGPIPEDQDTLAEILGWNGYRTALVSDLYHQFKPSKNYWRGFDEWRFIRGQETDPARSGPEITDEELDALVPRELRELRFTSDVAYGRYRNGPVEWFSRAILRNMRDRVDESQWFNAQVMANATEWLDQNADARTSGQPVFLTVECFDPHEPWFVPESYRRAYDDSDGQEQVISPYVEIPDFDPALLRRTRANYAGLVTMVDHWFGRFLDHARDTGWLDDTVVVVASDHGHALHERRGYLGKRGYPSDPEVVDVPLLIRHPDGLRAGETSDVWVQHHDLPATILELAGVRPEQPMDGRSIAAAAFGGPGADGVEARDGVVVGWGPAVTVVTADWWCNVKVDGQGALLYARDAAGAVGTENLAERQPDVVRDLFARAVAEADGPFPDYLLDLARTAADAPGCSPFAAIPLAAGPR